MEDLLKSIKAMLYERVSSPFIVTFTLSWSIINYKIILAIFSDIPFNEKIQFIDEQFSHAFSSVLMPIISTAFIIFTLPFVNGVCFWWTKKYEVKRTKTKYDLEKTVTLPLHKAVDLRDEIDGLAEKYSAESVRINRKLHSVESELDKAKSENAELLRQVKALTEEQKIILGKTENKILRYLAKNDGKNIDLANVSNELKITMFDLNLSTQKLANKKFIHISQNLISLTPSAREFINSSEILLSND